MDQYQKNVSSFAYTVWSSNKLLKSVYFCRLEQDVSKNIWFTWYMSHILGVISHQVGVFCDFLVSKLNYISSSSHFLYLGQHVLSRNCMSAYRSPWKISHRKTKFGWATIFSPGPLEVYVFIYGNGFNNYFRLQKRII